MDGFEAPQPQPACIEGAQPLVRCLALELRAGQLHGQRQPPQPLHDLRFQRRGDLGELTIGPLLQQGDRLAAGHQWDWLHPRAQLAGNLSVAGGEQQAAA